MLFKFEIDFFYSLETTVFVNGAISAVFVIIHSTERVISDYDGFIGKIWLGSIRLNPIINLKNIENDFF